MFKIVEGDFRNNKYSDEEYLDNWPMQNLQRRKISTSFNGNNY